MRRRARPLAGVLVTLALAAGCAAGASPSIDETAPTIAIPGSVSTTTAVRPSVPATTTTTEPATTTTTDPLTTGAPAGLTRESGNLSTGSKGLRTFALQKALAAQKFDAGEPDGAFGLKTEMAVWAFEALNGLPTEDTLNIFTEAAILKAKPAAMLRPDLGPTHSEVDLDKQVLLVFRDNQLTLVTHVSTGSGRHYCEKGSCGDAVTPVGDYRYQRRISGWRVAPLGRLYNPVYFNGGIAVHGAPSVPDYPASHGCVRIPMHIAEYFPSLVVNGEAISVFHGGVGGPGAAKVAPPPTDTTQPAPGTVLAGD